jgi:HAD superfamily phosphoserine phosphatase-like hydrolase
VDEILGAVAKAIETSGAAEDAPAALPVICFDADGTLWDGESGQLFARWLVDKQVLPGDVMERYDELYAQNVTEAYAWLTSCMAGLREREVIEYAAYFVDRVWRTHLYPEMAALIAGLERQKTEIWILSASNRWLVEEAARNLGMDRARCIGMAVKVVQGVLTDSFDGPVVNREGKVEAIDAFIGRRPIFAGGNSVHDLPMLHAATAGAMLVNPSSEADPSLGTSLRAYGYQRQWPVLDLERRAHGA